MNENETGSDDCVDVQGGEADHLPGGDDGRGGVQVRDHVPRHPPSHQLLVISITFGNFP
jgi:hypothetical protein